MVQGRSSASVQPAMRPAPAGTPAASSHAKEEPAAFTIAAAMAPTTEPEKKPQPPHRIRRDSMARLAAARETLSVCAGVVGTLDSTV